eukprot:gb/GEZN01005833.1/.p1 GENE.gb/GEZN01005833.1/~~gb/GEZN01005833.1/.p1  ORF type:complete len:382 (-),score=60.50 gb/GEZN01005833.1/:600-1631(-)
MKVLVFFREGFPYFSLREFDGKILRAPSSEQKSLKIQGASEQAIRARITQAILKLKLKPIKANKEEIRYLKKKGVLGKRAPKCSLLTCSDMGRLLKAFGRHTDAAMLIASVDKLDCEKGSPILEGIALQDDDSEDEGSTDKSDKGSSKTIKRSIEFSSASNQQQPRSRRKRKKIENSKNHLSPPPLMSTAYAATITPGSFTWQNSGQTSVEESRTPSPVAEMAQHQAMHVRSSYSSLSPVARETPSPLSSPSPSSQSPHSDNSRDSSIPLTPLSAVSQSTYGSPNTERFFFSPVANKIRPIDHQIYLLSPVQQPASTPVGLTKTSQADEAYLAMCSTLQPLGN